MNLILAILVATIVFCGFLIVDQIRIAQKQRDSLRMRIAPDGSTRTNELDETSGNLIDGEPSVRAQRLLAILRAMGVNVNEAQKKLYTYFGHAGISSPDGPIYYLFFQRVGSVFLCTIALMFFAESAEGLDLIINIFLGVILSVVGIFGPYLYLKNKIDHRRKRLSRAFPDTLDLLLICVESGLALDAGLNRVCSELGRAYPDMTQELNRTRLELSLLNDRVRALLNLGNRTNLVQFRALTAALIQSERFGTSLTDTLRVLSEDFRLERLSHAEAKAARIPVLMMIPLVVFLLPVLFIVILGPAIISIINDKVLFG